MMHATITSSQSKFVNDSDNSKKKKNLRIQKHPLVQDCINTRVYSTVT